MNDLVSIIMPSYNTAGFIAESIRSVQDQTCENWELIIVDDCSTDNTDDVVSEFLGDERIRYIKNEKNCGAAISRNRALRAARGRWIAFLDSDDLWLPRKLELQLDFMKNNGYAFTYTKYSEINEDGEYLGVTNTGPGTVGKRLMEICNFLGCLTVMYDSEVVGLVQIPNLKKRNDWAMWIMVSQKTPCHLCDEVLSLYRVRRSGSLSHAKGGKAALLKYHYDLFRKVRYYSPPASAAMAGVNAAANIMKKIIYSNRGR
ncbi:MAG: glycosyltransferase family 2 protein [Anaerovoracaceae bacterium]|jgi:glycosyltransferase involved in cell wall biosynthesis